MKINADSLPKIEKEADQLLEKVPLPKLDEIAKSLYVSRPFYGIVLQKINKRYDKSIPTACVNLRRELLVNPTFFSGMKLEMQLGVFEHEILHLAFLHLTRFHVQFSDPSLHKLINIACDCCINQWTIFPLPEKTISLDMFKMIVGDDVEVKEKETADYYFNLLMNKKKEVEDQISKMSKCPTCGGTKKKKNADGSQSDEDCPDCGGDGLSKFGKMLKDIMDGHSRSIKDSSKDGEGTEPDPFLESAMRSILQKAKEYQSAKDRQAGTEKGDSLLSVLPSYVTTDKMVWRRAINRCVGEQPIADTSFIYNRPNRRNPASNWGQRHDLVNNKLYVGIDLSASVSDKDIQQFVSHLSKAIRSYDLIVDLIYCDFVILDVKKKVKSIPMHKPVEVKGRGGTDLRHILDYIEKAEKGKKTRLVLMTDGETPFRPAPTIEITAIYTKHHTPLENVVYSATLEN